MGQNVSYTKIISVLFLFFRILKDTIFSSSIFVTSHIFIDILYNIVHHYSSLSVVMLSRIKPRLTWLCWNQDWWHQVSFLLCSLPTLFQNNRFIQYFISCLFCTSVCYIFFSKIQADSVWSWTGDVAKPTLKSGKFTSNLKYLPALVQTIFLRILKYLPIFVQTRIIFSILEFSKCLLTFVRTICFLNVRNFKILNYIHSNGIFFIYLKSFKRCTYFRSNYFFS